MGRTINSKNIPFIRKVIFDEYLLTFSILYEYSYYCKLKTPRTFPMMRISSVSNGTSYVS